MDERHHLILNGFADWAISCKKEYKERYEDPQILDAMESAEKGAMRAYERHVELDYWQDFNRFQQAKFEFQDEAYRYFLLRVHHGYETVGILLDNLKYHDEKWDTIISEIGESISFDQIGRCLRANDWLMVPLEEMLSVRATSLEVLKTNLHKRLLELKAKDYDAKFGIAKIYENYGREAALEHFKNKLPKKRGARKSLLSVLDLRRAYHYGQIVNQISDALLFLGLDPATHSEVVQVTLGNDARSESFDRMEHIRWVYSDFFHAANVSVAAFLNSLSRGRKEILEKYPSLSFTSNS